MAANSARLRPKREASGRRGSVLVTGVGGSSVGHQILQALQLVGSRYRTVATDASDFSFGLFEADSAYVIPRAGSSHYLRAISEIVEREKVIAVLPGTEAELQVISENADRLSQRGCVAITNPSQVVKLCSNKGVLYHWLSEHGFRVPRTANAHGWRKLVAEVGLPLIGKPTEGAGASRNVEILASEEEIDAYVSQAEESEREVVLQEYVGSSTSEYTVGVLSTRAGKTIDSIVLHRNLTGLSAGTTRTLKDRSYSLSSGYSQGFVVQDRAIQDVCERLARQMGSCGPLNVQCRVSEKDEVTIFEVHARFSGTSSIRAMVGFNEPDLLIRNFVFGEDFHRVEYQSDVAAIRAFRQVIVPIEKLKKLPKVLG
jgi:carbamoyl-phosphate synthase large subunit